jgi:D-alanyl-lipoteichoic acid acyltransferase DltB (MBOAT superfamily)
VEVYRGRQKPEHDFWTYALYVMFFPQLVAGPIERPQNLLHQFYETHEFDYDRICSGLKRIAWGLFKKVVVADRLALLVNDVYGAPRAANGLQLTLATVFFAYQIYCDFSGYSDIAIGSARVLGFKLMENFNTPYYAASVSEFWHRWHISLSTWFRDYVYLPMGGNRVGKWRWYVNIMTTFAISGLWHGANWTYVIWGLVNGIYVITGAMTQGVRDGLYGMVGIPAGGSLRRGIGIAFTLVITLAAWVFFRARNLADAGYIFRHFATNWDFHHIGTEQFLLRQLPAAIAGILIVEIVQLARLRISITEFVSGLPAIPRWSAYLCFVFTIVMFGVFSKAQFIYFQF